MTEQIREQDGRLIVALDGNVDLNRAPEIRRSLLDCVARWPRAREPLTNGAIEWPGSGASYSPGC